MADSYHYFRRLFRNNPALASGKALVTRPIDLQEDDLAGYELWKSSAATRDIFKWINQQFKVFTDKKQTSDDGIDFFLRSTESGMLIHAGYTELEWYDFFYLLLFIKDGLESYTVKRGEITVNTESHMAETRYTYVLKPLLDDHEIKLQFLKKEEFPVQLLLEIKGIEVEMAATFFKTLMSGVFERTVPEKY